MSSGGPRISQTGDCQSQNWGRLPIILVNFPRKLHRNETNWTVARPCYSFLGSTILTRNSRSVLPSQSIGGSKGELGMRNPRVQILSFSCSFWQRICKIIDKHILFRSRRPLWKTLEPPLQFPPSSKSPSPLLSLLMALTKSFHPSLETFVKATQWTSEAHLSGFRMRSRNTISGTKR